VAIHVDVVEDRGAELVGATGGILAFIEHDRNLIDVSPSVQRSTSEYVVELYASRGLVVHGPHTRRCHPVPETVDVGDGELQPMK
jgi:hypothetical protein